MAQSKTENVNAVGVHKSIITGLDILDSGLLPLNVQHPAAHENDQASTTHNAKC